ncbi:MAG: XdhC family protein [Bilophila wadsworthia]
MLTHDLRRHRGYPRGADHARATSLFRQGQRLAAAGHLWGLARGYCRPPRLSAASTRTPRLCRPVLAQVRATARTASISTAGASISKPLIHQGVVVLCGGGHVSLATGRLAHEVGFEVIAVDDREEYASPTRFPFARAVHVLPEFKGLAEACGIGPEHYIVIATRGHSHDRGCLSQAMHTTAHYVGMIGSKRKRDGIYSFLRSEGFPKMISGASTAPSASKSVPKHRKSPYPSSELIAARRLV